uniref:uridine kinase family protein n=1 Tax=uncultured Allobacillus sp. TaxID=1638025 RepID=UPI00259398E2|nr:P-loop NTPase fold protein [uncultured Allobacillus sp.]
MDNILQEIAKLIVNDERQIIVGVSGQGASGKTSFTNRLIKLLADCEINYLNTDPHIIPSSNIRKYAVIHYDYKHKNHRYKMTACHPGAHNISALEQDIRMIRDGLDIYTIGTNYMKSNLISSQNRITIIEGMSVAFTDLSLFDIKVYLYTDGETELMRRTSRDVSERGTSIEFLKQSHEERRIQYELFMHPYHRNFDIVIKNSNEGFSIEKNNLDL